MQIQCRSFCGSHLNLFLFFANTICKMVFLLFCGGLLTSFSTTCLVGFSQMHVQLFHILSLKKILFLIFLNYWHHSETRVDAPLFWFHFPFSIWCLHAIFPVTFNSIGTGIRDLDKIQWLVRKFGNVCLCDKLDFGHKHFLQRSLENFGKIIRINTQIDIWYQCTKITGVHTLICTRIIFFLFLTLWRKFWLNLWYWWWYV